MGSHERTNGRSKECVPGHQQQKEGCLRGAKGSRVEVIVVGSDSCTIIASGYMVSGMRIDACIAEFSEIIHHIKSFMLEIKGNHSL